MGMCVRVCVGLCLLAHPCMCDEGSALVFPAITCPGLPDLCRVGVLREAGDGIHLGDWLPGGDGGVAAQPPPAWVVPAPSEPLPGAFIPPQTCRPQPEPAHPASRVVLPLPPCPGLHHLQRWARGCLRTCFRHRPLDRTHKFCKTLGDGLVPPTVSTSCKLLPGSGRVPAPGPLPLPSGQSARLPCKFSCNTRGRGATHGACLTEWKMGFRIWVKCQVPW